MSKYDIFVKLGSRAEADIIRDAAKNEQLTPAQFLRACALQVIREGIARMKSDSEVSEALPSTTTEPGADDEGGSVGE